MNPETEAERIARIRHNLSLFKRENRPREEIAAYLESERVDDTPQKSWLEKIGQGAETLLSGVPLANKAVAGWRGILFGENPDEDMARQRGNINEMRSEHPILATGLQLAGGASLPLGPLKAAAGAGKLARAGVTAGNAVIGGGLAGASEADLQGGDVGDMVGGAATGAALSTALVGAMGGGAAAARGIGNTYKRVAATVSDDAADALSTSRLKALLEGAEGTAPMGPQARGPIAARETIARKRAAGGDPLAFEVLGAPGTQALRETTEARFGQGAPIVRESLESRAATAADRAKAPIAGKYGAAPKDAVVQEIQEETAKRVAPLYGKAADEAELFDAVARTVDPGDVADLETLARASELPYVQRELKRLRALPRRDYAKMQTTDHELLDQVYKNIGSDIRSLEAKQVSQKGLSSSDRSLLADLIAQREELGGAIAVRAPTYDAALGTFAEGAKRSESVKEGFGFVRMSPHNIKKALADGEVTTPEFRKGAGAWLVEKIDRVASAESGKGIPSKNPVAWLNHPRIRKQLKAALGDDYDDLLPTFREILGEFGSMKEASRVFAQAAKKTDTPDVTEAVAAASRGVAGFGLLPMLRRSAFAAGRTISGAAEGKAATATARKLSARGSALDDLLASLEKAPAPTTSGAGPRSQAYGMTESALARLMASLGAR